MKISKHHVVTLHYCLKNEAGEEIENSFNSAPMQYLHGTGSMIPGLEQALEGHDVGDEFEVQVTAEDAYGAYHPALVQDIPRAAFQGVGDIAPGMRFMAQTDQGPHPVVVTEVNDDSVKVDGNHPLAGQNLHFSVSIEEIREATEDEIAHGHLHGHGGCCGGHGHDDHECCGGHDHEDDHECCGGKGHADPSEHCCGGKGHCH